MKIVLLSILAGLLLLIGAGNVSAFDGKRSGIILGAGVGFGSLSFINNSVDRESRSYATFNFDFRIGVGLSDQFHIYWASKVGFYTLGGQGMRGPGVSYYLNERSPSPYFNVVVEVITSREEKGGGFAIGAGYEFVTHFSIEANIIKESNNDVDSITSVRVTLNALAF